MLRFRFTGGRNAVRQLRRTPATIRRDIKDIVKEIMFNDVKFKAQHLAQTKLNRDTTGTLRSNIKPFIKVVGKSIISGLKVDLNRVKYARIHELGGVIRPVRKRFLTIPFPGIKGFARDRQFQPTFIRNSTIFQKLPGGGIRPLFTLHPGPITIPPRPYLRPAIEAFIPKIIRKIEELEVEDR